MNEFWEAWNKDTVLCEDEVHIWRCNLSINANQLAKYWETLSGDEIVRVNQFHFKKDKIRYIAARGVLRSIISHYLHCTPQTIQFAYSKFGKPNLLYSQTEKRLNFNVAHSYDYAVFALSHNIVGVDIELCQDIPDLEEVARYCLSSDEYRELNNLAFKKKHDYFYKIWVLKEAFIKAIGLGLSYDLKEISMRFGFNRNRYGVSLANNQETFDKWTLQTFLAYEGFYSAFVTNQVPNRVLFLDFN